jgi:cytochrome c peroxidase
VDATQTRATPIFADTGTGEQVRVPTLRNLAATAPFMHDGRFATLDAVLDHYERLAVDPAADPRLRRAPLTTEERASLRAFLDALNDEH